MKTKVLFLVIVLVMAFTGTAFSQDFDWGDAPDQQPFPLPNYPTMGANSGAVHEIVLGMLMGVFIDAEPDGQPNQNATGDDIAMQDDADGVNFNSWVLSSQNASVIITVSVSGRIDAWVDFNIDGDWLDAGEQIFTNQSVNPYY